MRCFAYQRKGDCKLAITDCTEAIRLDPRSSSAYLQRASIYVQKKQDDLALADFNQGMTFLRYQSDAYPIAAWLMATSPNPRLRNDSMAIQYAIKASWVFHQSNEIPHLFDTLAAAYAEAGNFDGAVQEQQFALAHKLPEDDFSPKTRKSMQQRLELYEKHLPYRDKLDECTDS